MKKSAVLNIGTSGWHYAHWRDTFYPKEVVGYKELGFFSQHYNSVENNASFYRISKESTYQTWACMVPEGFAFSLKLNRFITHTHRLKVTDDTMERTRYILATTQVLREKLGAFVIQLPASFKPDHERLDAFLGFMRAEIELLEFPPDLAIEFRADPWFSKETYELLMRHNVALVTAQSSWYPEDRHVTSSIAYFRFHGPKELFASGYSDEELVAWAKVIRSAAKKTERVYVYFNNDINGHALRNANTLKELLGA